MDGSGKFILYVTFRHLFRFFWGYKLRCMIIEISKNLWYPATQLGNAWQHHLRQLIALSHKVWIGGTTSRLIGLRCPPKFTELAIPWESPWFFSVFNGGLELQQWPPAIQPILPGNQASLRVKGFEVSQVLDLREVSRGDFLSCHHLKKYVGYIWLYVYIYIWLYIATCWYWKKLCLVWDAEGTTLTYIDLTYINIQ